MTRLQSLKALAEVLKHRMKTHYNACEALRAQIDKGQQEILADLGRWEVLQNEAEALLQSMIDEQVGNLSLLATTDDEARTAEESDTALEELKSAFPIANGATVNGCTDEAFTEEETPEDLAFKEKTTKMDELLEKIRNRQDGMMGIREKKLEHQKELVALSGEYDKTRQAIAGLVTPKLPGATQLA